MASFNKVFLMGNLTRDPELRYTPNGTSVCEFGIAVNRRFTTKDGQQRDETCFVDVTMWGRRGEVISQYFTKGNPIFIEGRLKLDTWETADGRRSKHTVVAENFEFISGRGDQERARDQGDSARRGDRRTRPAGQAKGDSEAPRADEGEQEPEESGHDVSDDEIPF